MTNVYRLPRAFPGTHFIRGQPILTMCKITMEHKRMVMAKTCARPPSMPFVSE